MVDTFSGDTIPRFVSHDRPHLSARTSYPEPKIFRKETEAATAGVLEERRSFLDTFISNLCSVTRGIIDAAIEAESENSYFGNVIELCDNIEWVCGHANSSDKILTVAYPSMRSIITYGIREYNLSACAEDRGSLRKILDMAEQAIHILESSPDSIEDPAIPENDQDSVIYISAIPNQNELNLDLAGHSVLVLDNDPEILDIQVLRIEACNGNCITAGTAEDCIEQIENSDKQISVAIVDYNLGDNDSDGLEAAVRIKEISPDIQVIFCTSDSFDKWQIQILARAGVIDAYVKKPANPLKAIVQLLEV